MKQEKSPPTVLMIAYTNYRIDSRVIRQAEAAVSAGFEVDFLALRREGDPEVEDVRGVRVIHLRQSRYRGSGVVSYLMNYLQFFLRCFFKSTALYFKRHYKVIHVNNMPDFLVFSTIIPKLLGARIILDIHDPMPNTFASKFKSAEKGIFYRILLWQELASAHYADRVTTVHDPVKDLVLVKHGLEPDAIKVVANFADDEIFAMQPSYEVDGKVRLIFHGTILERYGLGMLIDALARVRHRDAISVRIIGEGDYSAALKARIAELNLGGTVNFENRTYPMHQIPQVVAGANLGIVPLEISSITNFALPLKLLEYISLGLPVLTVRNAAIAYYFAEEDCLFYQSDSVESLAAALDRIAMEPQLLMQYRKKSTQLREKFLWSNEKAKYICLLRELSGLDAARN